MISVFSSSFDRYLVLQKRWSSNGGVSLKGGTLHFCFRLLHFCVLNSAFSICFLILRNSRWSKCVHCCIVWFVCTVGFGSDCSLPYIHTPHTYAHSHSLIRIHTHTHNTHTLTHIHIHTHTRTHTHTHPHTHTPTHTHTHTLTHTVSSEPSANWVLIHPNDTVVELCAGPDSERGISATPNTTVTTLSTPELSGEELEGERSNSRGTQYTSYFPNRSMSSSSVLSGGESSVDMASAGFNENWKGLHSFLELGKRFFNFQNSPPRELPGSRHGPVSVEEEEEEEEGGEGEGEGQGGDVLPVVKKEPIQQVYDILEYAPSSQVELTVENKDLIHSELKKKFGLNEYVCARGSNSSPQPEESVKPSHKRTATWHSETEFSPARNVGKLKLKQVTLAARLPKGRVSHTNTPKMDANLRVQPHPIVGHRHGYGKFTTNQELWCLENLFDIFVHPSTIPEVYHYMKTMTASPFLLVELVPIQPPNKYNMKNAESAVNLDTFSDISKQDSAREVRGTAEVGLASSLVVRLRFATTVMVGVAGMHCVVADIHPQRRKGREMDEGGQRGDEEVEEEEGLVVLQVLVKVGHVVMSDVVRQQLHIKECSRVRLLHMKKRARMLFVDNINIAIHPISCSNGKVSD